MYLYWRMVVVLSFLLISEVAVSEAGPNKLLNGGANVGKAKDSAGRYRDIRWESIPVFYVAI